jgi:hypothetical protein
MLGSKRLLWKEHKSSAEAEVLGMLDKEDIGWDPVVGQGNLIHKDCTSSDQACKKCSGWTQWASR